MSTTGPGLINLDDLTASQAIDLAREGRVSPFARLDLEEDEDLRRRMLVEGVRQLGEWDTEAQAWVVPAEKQAALTQLLHDLGIKPRPLADRLVTPG